MTAVDNIQSFMDKDCVDAFLKLLLICVGYLILTIKLISENGKTTESYRVHNAVDRSLITNDRPNSNTMQF